MLGQENKWFYLMELFKRKYIYSIFINCSSLSGTITNAFIKICVMKTKHMFWKCFICTKCRLLTSRDTQVDEFIAVASVDCEDSEARVAKCECSFLSSQPGFTIHSHKDSPEKKIFL